MLHRILLSITAPLIAITLTSCGSTDSGSSTDLPRFSGPRPSVKGSSARPVNHLPQTEYPFDSKGNYITAWAAAGDKKYGAMRASSSRSSSGSRSSSSSSRSSSSSSYRSYTVKRGDTLWGISKRYGSSVSSIKRASGLSSDNIRIGQRLKIPR